MLLFDGTTDRIKVKIYLNECMLILVPTFSPTTIASVILHYLKDNNF